MTFKVFCSVFITLQIFLAMETNVYGRALEENIQKGIGLNNRVHNNTQEKNVASELKEDKSNATLSDVHIAGYELEGGDYYGIMANLVIFGIPEVGTGQSSGAVLTLDRSANYGFKKEINTIKAGWVVDPQRYGDKENHFFTSWTSGDSGCMDLDCPGFVRDDSSSLAPGAKLEQYNDITIKMFKDPTTGDWWVNCGQGDSLAPVGYFPKSLFSRLSDKAAFLQFGGFVTFLDTLKSPPMGSGQWPSFGLPGTAQIRKVRNIDSAGEPFLFQQGLTQRLDLKTCYGVGDFSTDNFLYGGPGGCK